MKTDCSPSRALTLCQQIARSSGNLWLAAGLLIFGRASLTAQETFIAYDVPAGTQQNQNGLATVSVGMDFEVANEIVVTRLGVFDASSDGISDGVSLMSRLWDRSQNPPVQIAALEFTHADPGELIGSSRFKKLDTPIHLPAGFQGTTSGDGWADTDSINNSSGNINNVLWTLHDGHGSIAFVGNSRYGVPADSYPATVDTGPAARYASSTFEFQTTALISPGKPALSIKGGDKQIVLTWPVVTQPAPAAKYRVSRADTATGPFTQIAEITDTTYTDSGLTNGTARSYRVEAVTAAGKVGTASDVKSAAAYALAADHFIAYFTPASVTGNQTLQNSLGMGFDIENPIIVTRLGIFDSDSDGLHSSADGTPNQIDARIFDRDNTDTPLVTLSFTPDDPGQLIEGMRFKDLTQPLRLEAGFHGLIEADGFVSPDPILNSGGTQANVVWKLNDANGSILFLPINRYGPAGEYPNTADGGPVARYAAGTFEFQALPPQVVGLPQVAVVTPFEDAAVTLQWPAVTAPLPALKYEIQRGTSTNGPFAKIGETTVPNFRDTSVQNGTEYFYVIRALGAGGKTRDSAVVSAIPNPRQSGIAYIVPANLAGNQPLPNYSVGMDFDVVHPIKVTKLGVFDDSSDGITMRVAAVLFNRITKKAMATLEFTPDKQGDLIGGSRFLPLSEPLILDEGFQGSIVMWFSDGSSERNYNTHGNPDPAVADLQLFSGGSILFVGSSRYGAATAPDTFPGTTDGGPVNRYGAGTFAFEPTTVDHPTFIAYSVPANSVGNQSVKGAAIGMDFAVENEIVLTRLGVFDDGSNGIKQLMTARIFDRDPTNPAPVQVAVLEFTPDSPGDLIGGSRFKPLPTHLHLPKGFIGTISVDYNDNLEQLLNSRGDPAAVTWTLNGGNGSINFVGGGRYGAANGFPDTADGGPAARYAAGTFEFQTTPPATPGTPVVTIRPLIENGAVTLTWPAITQPLPASKYEVLRSDTSTGPFAKIGESTDVTFHDTNVENGKRYYYIVRAIGAAGETGDTSFPVVASPSVLLVTYQVPGGLAGNQNLDNGAVGMDFNIVSQIKVTKLGVFDDSSDGIKMQLTAVLYDRTTQNVLASQDFTPDSQGELVGGSRFLNLSPPITLDTGFQGSIVIWYSDGHSERLWNSFGSSPANQAAHDAAGLQTFGGGSIEFVGGGRYGSAGDFPGTVDTGPADRYAGATFAFEPGSQVTRPTIRFARNGDKLTLMWDGGGALERTDVLGGTWQPVGGAASGIQITITGPAAYFRVHR